MELKESVMMDITDAFHGEDIKTDFFDFVVGSAAAAAAAAAAASETNNNNNNNNNHHHHHNQEDESGQHHNNNHHQHLQHMQQFAKQMRTVNAFLEGADHHNNNNNNHHHHEVNVKQEPNNNNNDGAMLLSEVATATATTPTAAGSPQNVTNFDASFWSDKETVRIETAILEDLNRYCWSSEEANGGGDAGCGIGVVEIGSPSRNGASNVSDGQIYTLTVLNGIDQSATWYRPPKEEEVSVSSPGSMEHLHGAGLDIDSILNIMPGQMGAYNNFGDSTMSPSNTDGLIKSEINTYEDSGFADNKDELTSTLIIDTPLLEAHDSFNNNNNNDWKLTNNNTTAAAPAADDGSPDSLLRSALQGKTYGVRYNGGAKANKGESNTELRRVLSTPPGKTEAVYLKEEQGDHIPTIVAGIDANGKVVFEEHVSPRLSQDNAENNPSSTHSVDDLLLSQLDHPFPEDFEKLKRIANEVAESVSQYCQIDASGESSSISPISNNQIGILYSLTSPIQISTPVASATSSTSSKQPKKYKRQTSASKSSQSSVQTATSTSNGVRKERSLHYCSICSKGFKDKYSVNVHIRTHTGEKPFACSLCGKSFRQKAHLAKHYQTHIAQKNAAAAGGGGGGGGGSGTIASTTASKAKSR